VAVPLICPNCKVQSAYEADPGWNQLTCPSCKKRFKTLIGMVRAKRSRGNRKNQSREFDVRVRTGEYQEELIQFTAAGYEDFELRSSDAAAFSYYKDTLYIVHNFKIGRYMVVRQPNYNLLVLVPVIVGIVIFIGWVVSQPH
jgi:hypothetical protein